MDDQINMGQSYILSISFPRTESTRPMKLVQAQGMLKFPIYVRTKRCGIKERHGCVEDSLKAASVHPH